MGNAHYQLPLAPPPPKRPPPKPPKPPPPPKPPKEPLPEEKSPQCPLCRRLPEPSIESSTQKGKSWPSDYCLSRRALEKTDKETTPQKKSSKRAVPVSRPAERALSASAAYSPPV